MAHLRVGTVVKRRKRQPRAFSKGAPATRTPASLLRGLGRLFLWLLGIVLLIRGAAGLLERSHPVAAGPARSAAPVLWPDDEARAFTVEFARAYPSHSPQDPERYAQAVRASVALELTDSVVTQGGADAAVQAVESAPVARTAAMDASRAPITGGCGRREVSDGAGGARRGPRREQSALRFDLADQLPSRDRLPRSGRDSAALVGAVALLRRISSEFVINNAP